MRTQPDRYTRCEDCGAPHNIDTSIPSPTWNAICRNGVRDAEILCTLCIDDRLAAAGQALRGKLYGPLDLGGGPPLSCEHATAERCGAICGFCLRAWWDAARPVDGATVSKHRETIT